MKTVHIARLSIDAEGNQPAQGRQLGRRVAELLGESLAVDQKLASQRRLAVAMSLPPGLSTEMAAAYIARAIRARLG